ncbi:MAG TPA: hypothetical protein VKQ27_00775, partial [Acetobacteraceae bacterium]|nr:hypothetical protein [Acetobacteraceae bacterium]
MRAHQNRQRTASHTREYSEAQIQSADVLVVRAAQPAHKKPGPVIRMSVNRGRRHLPTLPTAFDHDVDCRIAKTAKVVVKLSAGGPASNPGTEQQRQRNETERRDRRVG